MPSLSHMSIGYLKARARSIDSVQSPEKQQAWQKQRFGARSDGGTPITNSCNGQSDEEEYVQASKDGHKESSSQEDYEQETFQGQAYAERSFNGNGQEFGEDSPGQEVHEESYFYEEDYEGECTNGEDYEHFLDETSYYAGISSNAAEGVLDQEDDINDQVTQSGFYPQEDESSSPEILKRYYSPEARIEGLSPASSLSHVNQQDGLRSPIQPPPLAVPTQIDSFQIPMVAQPAPQNAGSASAPWELQLDNTQWLGIRSKIENIIGYRFICNGLPREAMFPIQSGHAFFTNGDTDKYFQQGNRRLAILGETIMRSVIVDVWFRHEGAVEDHEAKVSVVTSDWHLAWKARQKGIEPHIKAFFLHGRVRGRDVLATTVKALVGAVWLDGKKRRDVVRKVLDKLLDTKLEVQNEKW